MTYICISEVGVFDGGGGREDMEEVTVEVEPQTQQLPGNGRPIISKKAICPVTLKV